MENTEHTTPQINPRAPSSCLTHTARTTGPTAPLSKLTLSAPDRRWLFAATGVALCLTGCASIVSSIEATVASEPDQVASEARQYPLAVPRFAAVSIASTPLARASAVSENSSVVVTPVYTNRHFDLRPLSHGGITQLTEQRQVKILGTYYPKGIYSQPDPASRVLMRLAPGTLLELERQFDSWYRVATVEGTGYLRADDGRVQHSQTSD
jgi:hypothetical protein